MDLSPEKDVRPDSAPKALRINLHCGGLAATRWDRCKATETNTLIISELSPSIAGTFS